MVFDIYSLRGAIGSDRGGNSFEVTYFVGSSAPKILTVNDPPAEFLALDPPDYRFLLCDRLRINDWPRLKVMLPGSALQGCLHVLSASNPLYTTIYTDLRASVSDGDPTLVYQAWQAAKAALNENLALLSDAGVPWDQAAQDQAADIFLRCNIARWVDDAFEPFNELKFESLESYEADRAAAIAS